MPQKASSSGDYMRQNGIDGNSSDDSATMTSQSGGSGENNQKMM